MSRLLEALRLGHVLLMDGAMGTELQRAGLQEGDCCEEWNLSRPLTIRAVHQAFAAAGAVVFLTNTFQADLHNLGRRGLADNFDRIRAEATGFALDAAPPGSFVLADVGPFPETTTREAVERLAKSCGRNDGLLQETLSSPRDGQVSLRAAIERLSLEVPYFVSFSFAKSTNGSLRTASGDTPERCARDAYQLGANALGVNCGREMGIPEVAEVIRRYRDVLGESLPLFARPNAGTPTRIGDQWVYPRTPEMMADQLPQLLEAGVNMVGGCCGTTPAHIAAFRRVIDTWNSRQPSAPD